MAAFTEEQALIREQASAWALKESPVSQFRALRDAGDNAGFEQATWGAMIEMGWTGILVPEEYGGSDLGMLTFGLVLEQLGRHGYRACHIHYMIHAEGHPDPQSLIDAYNPWPIENNTLSPT